MISEQARVLGLPGAEPSVDPAAVVLPGATVVGEVAVGAAAGLWYGSVVRADAAPVRIGARTNLQDGVIVHADPGFPAEIGTEVTVGHGAVVHGAVVEDGCLIGMRSVVMNGARIGAGSLVAAGAVVTEGTQVPPGSLVAGVPGKVRRELTDGERAMLAASAEHYAQLALHHESGAQPVRGLRTEG